jgi:fibronectin type 3 domain-containing protein
VTTPADSTAPSTPAGLTAKAVKGPKVKLAWNPSSDDVGVTGYRVFRDGAAIATTGLTSYVDTNVKRATVYRYAVSAFDAVGNESAPSAPVSVKAKKK